MPDLYPDCWHEETVCGEQGWHELGTVLRRVGRCGSAGRAEHRLGRGAPAAGGQSPAQRRAVLAPADRAAVPRPRLAPRTRVVGRVLRLPGPGAGVRAAGPGPALGGLRAAVRD